MYKKERRTLYSITQYIYSTSSFCSITKQKKMHIAYKKRVRERERKKGGLHVQIRKQKLKQKDKSHKKTKHVQIKMKIT
jgi:hypothetical protein